MKPRSFLAIAVLAATNLIAGAAFLDVFRADDVLVLLVLCALGPFLVGSLVLVARPASGVPLTLGVQVAVFLIVWALLSVVTLDSTPSVTTLLSGWQDAWRTIATAVSPAPPRAELVALPAVLLWGAGTAAVEMATRTSWRLAPVVPSITVAVAGTLLSSGEPALLTWPWLLLAGLVLGFVAVRARSGSAPVEPAGEGAKAGRRLVLFRSAVVVPVSVGLVLVAAGIVDRLPFVQPDEAVLLRDSYEAERSVTSDLNPLATVGPVTGDPQVAFEVELSSIPATTLRFRTAVLDRFDGNRWTSSAAYVPTGTVLPSSNALDGEFIEQRYRIVSVDGPYLPVLGSPVEVDAPSEVEVLTDEIASGLVVADSLDSSGLAYSVSSQLDEIDPVQLQNSLLQSSTDALGPSFVPPVLPPPLEQAKTQVVGDAIDPFDQLALLREFFRNNEQVHTGTPFEVTDEVQVPLNSYYIGQFVTDAPGGRRGSTAMFAAAFTALAQSQGIPARLAVGYVPSAPVDGASATLTDHDLTVWPEVAFEGIGWVAFDPVPQDDQESLPLDQQNLDLAVDGVVDQAGGDEPLTPPPVIDDDVEDERGLTAAQLGVGSIVLLALLLLGVPPTWKWARRRRRRRSGTSAERVVAAWIETVDGLVESGLTSRRSKTPSEVVATCSQLTPEGVQMLSELASLTDVAVNAKAEPVEADAARAWALDGQISGQFEGRGVAARLKRRMSIRPLVGAERS
jgi:transglutaminase-like putative cysteine protease